ncbi:hypothetical protein IMSAGC019_03370 [Lachnospiraceae bacterium]|nr:hypothetical protein IMSAGC019_03370 [Lachnospiraceae bacterium]
MPCTEAYKEHIEYTFNAFCRVVIHYAAINAWRDRDRRRQREISFEYLTEEKFYPLSTTDKYFIDPCKQYPVTICGQRVILTNGNLAEALSSLPEKKREIIYLYFFGHYTQQEIGELYGRCRSTAWHHIDEVTMYATTNANLRSGPDTTYDIVGSLTYAQEITYNGKVESDGKVWYVLKNEDKTEMVSGSLLSTTKPQPKQATPPSSENSQPSSGCQSSSSEDPGSVGIGEPGGMFSGLPESGAGGIDYSAPELNFE